MRSSCDAGQGGDALSPSQRRRQRWRVVAMLAAVGLLMVAGVWASPYVEQIESSLGPVAPVLTIPIQAMVSLSPLPGDLLCIANGAMYGFLLGGLYSWLGWLLATLIEFRLARAGSKAVGADQYLRSKSRWLNNLPFDHPLYLLAARQIPGLGGHLVAITAATTDISTRRFMAYAAVSIVPGAIVMPGIGAGVTLFL